MSRERLWIPWTACLLAIAGTFGSSHAMPSVGVAPKSAGGKPVDPPRSTTSKLESAKLQLEHADDLRKAVRGTKPEERIAAQRAAVEAYRSVREYFGSDSAACAEASFRAGEILRAGGDFDGARSELKLARDRGAGSPWKVRGMLELGHLERRVGRREDALTNFEAVIAAEDATPRQRDEASLAAGRTHADLGHGDDAARLWKRVADDGEDPLQRIRAWDLLALQLVQKGDLEGAAGMVERCREALHEAAQEESKQGERVRDALTGMRAIDEVARATAERARKKSESARDD